MHGLTCSMWSNGEIREIEDPRQITKVTCIGRRDASQRSSSRLNFLWSTCSPYLAFPLRWRRHMLGLGLRLARPLASPTHFLVTGRWAASSRSLHLAATFRRLSCYNTSRILQLSTPPKSTAIRNASSSAFPPVHSVALITRAEAEADADPNNVDIQVLLFKLLIESQRSAGWNVILSRWERMCEFVSPVGLSFMSLLMTSC